MYNICYSRLYYYNANFFIVGTSGIDYPAYETIVKTDFSCIGRPPGFYADIETRCQVWHVCNVDETQQSFLCNNGTIFSQPQRVCDWWYNANVSSRSG